jgi:hypothetical protein
VSSYYQLRIVHEKVALLIIRKAPDFNRLTERRTFDLESVQWLDRELVLRECILVALVLVLTVMMVLMLVVRMLTS